MVLYLSCFIFSSRHVIEVVFNIYFICTVVSVYSGVSPSRRGFSSYLLSITFMYVLLLFAFLLVLAYISLYIGSLTAA
jgi:hypothetical protein